MGESNGAGSAVAIDWQLEFAHLVVFTTEPALFLEQNWWHDLAPVPPEEFSSTKKRNFREERGTLGGVVLTLRVDADRVAWLVQPRGEPDEATGKYPVVGPFRDNVDWFVDLLSPWLAKSCPSARRLAFIGKLLQPAASSEEAYRVLGERLRDVNLRSLPNDLYFQVNRRRNSETVPGLPINRVSAWSKLNLAVAVRAGTPFSWPDDCYAALEVDVNTAPERGSPLPSEALPSLFREMASLAVEIADRGDVP